MSVFGDNFTLGVEEEYQLVHAESRELRSYISRIVEDGKSVLRERVRPEMHQSMVEVGTSVCPNVAAVRSELTEIRRELSRIARRGGMAIVAAGTHPFSDWRTQEITDNPRYHGIIEDLQDVARANLIFGLHVHVGIKEKQVANALANQVRYFLPHLLALSVSSPLWLGRRSGLMSTRSEIFKRFPRTGIPDEFETYGKLREFIELLVRTNCIDNAKKIWWDVRVHYIYETVEIRICDMPTRLDHTIAITALIQALMAQLYLLHKRNMAWRTYPRSLIEENKWRAVRYGARGKLIDFGEERERPFAELVDEMISFAGEAASMLGTEKDVAAVRDILRDGTSAEGQLQVHEKSSQDGKAVVDWLIRETMRGLEP
jgi:glutamate---cysteine ligase / carboxylate-amine ligase